VDIYTSKVVNSPEIVPDPRLDEQHVRRFVSLLTLPVELRIPNSPQKTVSGYFDDPERLVGECEAMSGGLGVEAVYVTLNPVKADLLARADNRVKGWARATTADADITRRVWLPVDCDAVRPAGISATGLEKDAAIATVREVRSYLAGQGFPAPLLGDSGNGGHLLYRIDLPNTTEVAELMSRFLDRLAGRFNADAAKLDTTVYNAARIWKVYGTRVQKGDEVGDRRHRLARILEVPDCLEPVPLALIEKVVGQESKPAFSLPDNSSPAAPGNDPEAFARSRLLAEQVIKRGGLEVVKEKEYRGGVLWVLDHCPFCDNADGTAHVEAQPSGKLCFACKHNRCRDRHWKDFRAKCDPDRQAGSGDQQCPEEATPLPAIVVNGGQPREITEQALAAIRQANEPPKLFRRGLEAAQIVCGESGVSLKDLKAEDVLSLLSEVADWKRERKTKEGVSLEDAHPPENAVKTVRSRLAAGLPELRAVVEAPVFTATGRLLVHPGYDAESGLYFSPGKGLELPPNPEVPSSEDIEHAKRLLLVELMGDFPFADEASRSHALAALLLPFVRPLIDGPTPLHFIDAPAEGTGKGKLADAICVPSTGRDAPKMAEVQGEAEWVKTLLAALRSAPAFFHLDDVRHPLDSAALASVLTAYPDWQARLLGTSLVQNVPVLTAWLATGNNVHASKEVTRRIVRVRLDAKMEHPNTRTGFRHPHLIPWAKKHRAELLWAALTLCRAWLAAGRPLGGHTLGSYECWAGVMGGILDVAGVPGFLANMASLYEEVNTGEGKWREFVLAWASKLGTQEVGVADLYNLAVNHQLALFDDLVERSKGKGEQSQRVHLGFLLTNRLHQCYGGFRIERGGDGRNGRLYKLAALEAADFPPKEHASSGHEEPALLPLPELTKGKIPLDIPYSVTANGQASKGGTVAVDFWLTEGQHAGLPKGVKSRLMDGGEGRYGWAVRA
jgi:hypothetical protein